MQQIASHKTVQPSSPNGSLIIKIKNGEVNIYPIGNSDREVAEVLEAVRMAIVQGDLARALT